MPDEHRLPQDLDFVPYNVGYVSQGIGPKLPVGSVDEELSKKKNDLEKFTYLWHQDEIHEMITLEPEFSGKDQVVAAGHRQKGNSYFKKKSYLSAMESYNLCIIHGLQSPPEEGDHELTLAYNNRSAALFHLKKYELSLRDIEMALDTGYPSDSLYKLYDRKGKCFYALKQKLSATESFRKALEYVGTSKLEEKGIERWKADLEKQIKACEELPDEETTCTDFNRKSYFSSAGHYSKTIVNSYKDNYKLPKVTPKPSETHTSASNTLEFKYDKNMGRHAVAKQDITIGNSLIVEKPYAAVLLPDFYPDHCYNCLARIVAPIPCSQCVSVLFCSTECQKEAWDNYHKFECNYFVLFDENWCGRLGHLAHRLILTIGLDKVMTYITDPQNLEDITPERRGLSKEGKYSRDLKALLNLETNYINRTPAEVLQFACFAVFLTKVFKSSGYLKSESTIEVDYESDRNLQIIGSVILQLLQAIQCNGKGVKEALSSTDFESIKPTDIGVGMYTTAALINHSCYPNAELIFYGSNLALRATRMIYEGQEITCSYGPRFWTTAKLRRMKCLSTVYGFVCNCEACTNEWPMWRDVESKYPEFACENCHRYIDFGEMTQGQYLKCEACQFTKDMNVCWGQLTVSHEEYAKAIQNAVHMKLDLALPRLAGHLMLMQKHLKMPWKDMLVCESAVQNCYVLMGNKKVQFTC